MAILVERSQTQKREDLADLISLVDARSTPVLSMARKGKQLGNSIFSWQADAYDAADSGGTVDGSDVSTKENPAANRATMSTYGQYFRKAFGVSRLAQEVSNVAGIGKNGEMAKAQSKKMVELKRNIEKAICSSNENQADNGTVPYLTRGLDKWIQNGAQAVLPVPAAFRTPTASISTGITTLTETIVQDVMKSQYEQTGEQKDFTLVCGTDLKRAFTGLCEPAATSTSTAGVTGFAATKVRTFNKEQGDGAFVSSVDVFRGDFGSLKLLASNFLPNQKTGYILDMDKIELRYGYLPDVQDLPNNGSGPSKVLEAFVGLCVHNPLGLGKLALA